MLFWILVIVFICYYVSKKNADAAHPHASDPLEGREPAQIPQSRTAERSYRTQQRQVTDADRARLETYRAKKASVQGAAQKTAPASAVTKSAPAKKAPASAVTKSAPAKKAPASAVTKSAAAKAYASVMTKSVSASGTSNRDILSRAQQNVRKYEADVTLEELESSHDHTERATRTRTKAEEQQRKAAHPHDAAHVSELIGEESESLLASIEDLMVKGYTGTLSFERDFVGEGMDMISRFTVPDTISGETIL